MHSWQPDRKHVAIADSKCNIALREVGSEMNGCTSSEMKRPFPCPFSSNCLLYAALSSVSFRTCVHNVTFIASNYALA